MEEATTEREVEEGLVSAQVQGSHSILGLMSALKAQRVISSTVFILVIKNVYTLLTLVCRFTSIITVGGKNKTERISFPLWITTHDR